MPGAERRIVAGAAAVGLQGRAWSNAMLRCGKRVDSERGSDGMSPRELQKFKEAIAKIDREYNTPKKAKELLIKIGYLTPDGQVAERYR
jgi:hypothetical protein